MSDYSSKMFDVILNSIKNKDALKLDKSLEVSSIKRNKEIDPFALRNKKYNDLIDGYTIAYNARHRCKNKLKTRFFWIVMPVYILVVCTSLFILIASLFIKNSNITLIIGAIGSLITTLIAIPTIIANYLFPKQEDSNLVDMFQLMFDFDTNYYNSIKEATTKASQKAIEQRDEKKEDCA